VNWKRRSILGVGIAAVLIVGSGAFLLACPSCTARPKPVLCATSTPPQVIIRQGLEGVGFRDEKALRNRIAELLDERMLEFWQAGCSTSGKRLRILISYGTTQRYNCSCRAPCSEVLSDLIRLRGPRRTRHTCMQSSSMILVCVPPATARQLVDLDQEQRLAIIRQPGAITIERQPGRF
jgi:hypothetical protein